MAGKKQDNRKSRQELPLTVANAHIWKLELMKLIEGDSPAQLNLADQEDCDTAGIQLLLAAKVSAHENNKSLTLVNPGIPVREAAKRLGIELSEEFQVME